MLLSVHDYGTIENTFDGDWSLFKLLNVGIIKKESSSLYNVNWYYKKENQFDIIVSYQLQASSSKNPFSGGFFKGFNLPRSIN
jgi:type VI protein secretion system component VasK